MILQRKVVVKSSKTIYNIFRTHGRTPAGGFSIFNGYHTEFLSLASFPYTMIYGKFTTYSHSSYYGIYNQPVLL